MTIMTRSAGYLAGTALLCGAFLAGPASASAASHTQSITHETKGWTITLKLLPAETFAHVVKPSTQGEMYVRGGLGRPLPAAKANHHLVVFLKHDGQAVTNAKVTLRYRRQKPRHAGWHKVPVVRMDIAGKGARTTHYGNNVLLKPGKYDVSTSIDGRNRTHFELDVD